jgi:hypothetical protein
MLPVGAIAQTAPGLLMNWRDTELTHSQCVNVAKRALSSAGFVDGGVVKNSRGSIIYGFNDGYHGAIRCLQDRNIAMFVVTGESTDQSVVLGDLLTDYWDNAR